MIHQGVQVKAKSIYISSVEPHSGSLIVTMGLMEIIRARYDKVAFYRPFIHDGDEKDSDIVFMLEHYNLDIAYEDTYSYTVDEVELLISQNKSKALHQKILEDFRALQKRYEVIVCEGLNRESFSPSISLNLNLSVSKNLNTPFISVINAKGKSQHEVREVLDIEREALLKEGCQHMATFVNRVDTSLFTTLCERFRQEPNCFILPEVKELDYPTVREIKKSLSCALIIGKEQSLSKSVQRAKIAAMTLENYLARMEEGDLVIVPSDRADIIVGVLAAYHSKNHPSVAALILSGSMEPSSAVMSLFEGIGKEETSLCVLRCEGDTFSMARAVDKVHAHIRPGSERKIALSIGTFNANVDISALKASFLQQSEPDVMTPLMFEFNLFERAREQKKRIVLPESLDERILRAAEILLRRELVEIIFLGSKEEILFKAESLALDISKARIIDPKNSEYTEAFVRHFYEQRKAKGLSLVAAQDAMVHGNYFATMMVELGHADGMVSGAIHTTQDTIRPALQIIKTKPGIELVSSLFFMCMDTKVLVYADCAVNQDPDAAELAQIAISSAATAKAFGLDVRIAMLSYSTGDSGKGEDVQKVKDAVTILKRSAPELLVEGPIQYDAAIDPVVAAKKLPGSKVAGQATIFIFPDLNTGNNTYKAVQRSSGAVAIGPILQGLKKPVNDLSRGCLVTDIVNTVAITAIQAQEV